MDDSILSVLVDVAEEFRMAAMKDDISATLLITSIKKLGIVVLEGSQRPLSKKWAAASFRPSLEQSELPRHI